MFASVLTFIFPNHGKIDVGTILDEEVGNLTGMTIENAQDIPPTVRGRGIAYRHPADYDDILRNVEERDYIDSHREVSPLRQADDALLLDNSDMTIAEQKQWLLERFKKIINS